jgi:GTPase SAR1 family protein
LSIIEENAIDVRKHIDSIVNEVQKIDSNILLVLVPASIQVCDADDLAYLTRGVNPTQSDLYDLDQPQRIAKELLNDLDIPHLDLRPALSASQQCPYQRRNMHWTEQGHQIVAKAVAEYLISREQQK